MPKFIINEVKEITIEAEIIAKSAQEAMGLYKGTKGKIGSKASEETHIIVKEIEEVDSVE
ncbi:hypothetical protein [Bacillus sp. FJAT-49736]|uniref:hypothetical protein n=1 Tax=Bacillus sp. FJAT-49736 TaxID=2833582 RepID=UPI001BC967AE|nr:hypothetical protein [Bacillus sp. FJAT-49736]MBS4172087.1 hypothetical protein [Bacillus sp. FJAT-49736]